MLTSCAVLWRKCACLRWQVTVVVEWCTPAWVRCPGLGVGGMCLDSQVQDRADVADS